MQVRVVTMEVYQVLGFRLFPMYYFRVATTPSLRRRGAAVRFGTSCREDVLVRGPTIANPYANNDLSLLCRKYLLKLS